MSPRCTGRWCGSWRRPRGRCCTRAPWSTSRNAMNRATSPDPSSRSATRRSTASRSATTLSDHPIAARWRAVRAERRAALIPYVTAGYPTPAACRDALRAAERAGADFVEVGVPFSDPLADGPTIQRSTQAALDQGMTVAGVFDVVREARLGIPVILMTYLNPVLAFGVERFVAEAQAAGASGLLLTDLPAGADPALERRVADGVVVGSALVEALGNGGLASAERLLAELATAVRAGAEQRV